MNVLIADDHVIIRRGLKFLLDSHFGKFTIYETESTQGILDLMTEKTISHLILDMQLQDGNVLEIFQVLRKKYPDVAILIYTMSPEDIFGKRMLHLGANGFLNKQSPEPEVLRALELFFNNKKYISPVLQDLIAQEQSKKGFSQNPFEQLSDRETEVLNYLLKGAGVKEIAEQLDLKANTVATFKARLFDKLGVSNLIDLQNLARVYRY
ncbi:MAG: response regulator transcription factor [Bacteroidetes bacterium]|nr:response regulator transcription factor [Bacteroidota bacterium]